MTNNTLMATYIKSILKFPVMTRSEETKVAKKAMQGDKKAKEKLVLANLRFVIKVAKQYTNTNIPLVDLVNEGNLGLIRAVESFDVSKGNTFISYAIYWIKQSIIKAISEKFKIMYIPLNANVKLVQVNKELEKLKSNESLDDCYSNLSKQLGIKKHTLIQLLEANKSPFSFDKVFKSEDDDTATLKNYIADREEHSGEIELFKKDLKKQLQKILKKLSPLEREIIDLRYNLTNQQKSQTLESIGKIKGYTKERIRQIEKNALQRLRDASSEKGKWGSLKDYLESMSSNFQSEFLYRPSF